MSAVRVVIIDASYLTRRALQAILGADSRFEVLEAASGPVTAIEQLAGRAVDVVLVGSESGDLNGTIGPEAIRRSFPVTPVLVLVRPGVSSLPWENAARSAKGAIVHTHPRPQSPSWAGCGEEYASGLRAALVSLKSASEWQARMFGPRQAPAERHQAALPPPPVSAAPRSTAALAPARPIEEAAPPAPPPRRRVQLPRVNLVVIGASTGGPKALATLLAVLPPDLGVPVVIVQHMPPDFTGLLTKRLGEVGPLEVCEASDGEALLPNRVYVAPGGVHLVLRLERGKVVARLLADPPVHSCRPAVDPLFLSAAATHGEGVLGVVLTGMGRDGADGAMAIRGRGGQVIAQDEATSVVWGMPGCVVRQGSADAVLAIDNIAPEIVSRVKVRKALRPAF